jgi:hypothetical protein
MRAGDYGCSRKHGHSDIAVQIDVDNRDYHYLSQSEIAGGKRIYQHVSEPQRFFCRK